MEDYEDQRLQHLFELVMSAMPELGIKVRAGEAPAVKFQCRKHHRLGTLTVAVDNYGWRMAMPDAGEHVVIPASLGQKMGSPLANGHGHLDPLRRTLFMCRPCGLRRQQRPLHGENRRFEDYTFSAEALFRGYLWALKRGRKNLTVADMDDLAKAKVTIEDLITRL